MTTPLRLAVLASGGGSNAAQLMAHFAGHPLAQVTLVVSDRKAAGVHAKAAAAGVPSVFIGPRRRTAPGGLLQVLQQHRVDAVLLAGYLRLIPADVLSSFPEKVINIHPALLPKYGGPGMYGAHVHRAVQAAGDRQSGITIHLANAVYDEGRVLFQASTPVLPADDADAIAAKVLRLEHQHYPAVVEAYLHKLVDKTLTP